MTQPEHPRAAPPPWSSDLRLPPIEPLRLYRQIATLIGERIDDGGFPVGSLLPAERDLARQLGVSRTSVREALIALEVAGKVSIRVGQGVRILAAPPRIGAGGDAGDADIGPLQLMQARRHVELKTADLAACHRQSDNLHRLERAIAVQAGVRSVADPDYRGGDRAFHVEIARASGNAAYALVIANLWDHCFRPMFATFEELLTGPDRPAQTVAEHRAILAAIVAGDRAAARRAMKLHLNAVIRAFSQVLGAR